MYSRYSIIVSYIVCAAVFLPHNVLSQSVTSSDVEASSTPPIQIIEDEDVVADILVATSTDTVDVIQVPAEVVAEPELLLEPEPQPEPEPEPEYIEEETIESAEPILGEGAGESRSAPEFVSKVELVVATVSETRSISGVEIDPLAEHSCKPAEFNIVLTDGNSVLTHIGLTKTDDNSTRLLTVGSLPQGIDIRFTTNNEYELGVVKEDVSVGINITRTNDAQAGSFTVPLLYTIENTDTHSTSTTLCQLNVVSK